MVRFVRDRYGWHEVVRVNAPRREGQVLRLLAGGLSRREVQPDWDLDEDRAPHPLPPWPPQLADRGITVGRSCVDEYCTSLAMAGASLTLIRLDDEIEDLLAARPRSRCASSDRE